MVLYLPLMFLLAPPQPPQGADLPDYFVKIMQRRTLFAQNEKPTIYVRVGNSTERPLKARRFPKIIDSLVVEEGGVPLERAPGLDPSSITKKDREIPIGGHKDFPINLADWFPAIRKGGVFQVHYNDGFYELSSRKIQVAKVEIPDLASLFVVHTSMGDFTLELAYRDAPQHAANFAILTKMSFYRDLIFHRVESGFVFQTGDPLGSGKGGSGFPLPLETSVFQKHKKYALGMARMAEVDSASSQFYVCLADAPDLDNLYTVFGKVTAGFEVVDAIGQVATSGSRGRPPHKPLEDVVLYSIEIKPKP